MQITKQFKFSYGHVLPNHSGKCRRLHGHNAVLEVTVADQPNRSFCGDPDEGMVMDFGKLKEIVERVIIKPWDHYTLVAGDESIVQAFRQYDETAPISDISGLTLSNQLVNVGCRTTAENLARLCYERLITELVNPDNNLGLIGVKFFETETSWAEYTHKDWLTDNEMRKL